MMPATTPLPQLAGSYVPGLGISELSLLSTSTMPCRRVAKFRIYPSGFRSRLRFLGTRDYFESSVEVPRLVCGARRGCSEIHRGFFRKASGAIDFPFRVMRLGLVCAPLWPSVLYRNVFSGGRAHFSRGSCARLLRDRLAANGHCSDIPTQHSHECDVISVVSAMCFWAPRAAWCGSAGVFAVGV